MNLYGAANTILEVEYIGEVGTGSGPTLEFYAQVAEILRTSEPRLFREGVPGGMLFPQPYDPEWLQAGREQAPQILERFRLLGQIVAKCILDNRLVDLQLHPFFWRSVLGNGPFSHQSLRDIDAALYSSMQDMREMSEEAVTGLCVDFTLPGHPKIELAPAGASKSLSRANIDEYVGRVTEVTLVSSIAHQVAAFRSAFSELLPLETCRIWSEVELASLILGSSVRDNAFWTTEHLTLHIKAQHGYNADSRCFRDLLSAMSEFSTEDRRKFLTFVTGAPSLPIGGFGGLKPPLTVVKKESPPAPLTPDQFMPSVMTCANYLKLPEYSCAETLRQKLEVAMLEGQSAFLLS
jgi:E3 ubiquitin-protein ligase TRIP12